MLTTSSDPVIGTDKNDIITAATGTLNAGDLISDKYSTDNDTLNVTTATAADMAATPTISGIENINVNIDAFAGTNATVDAKNIKGATITLSSSKLGFDGVAGVSNAETNSVVAGTNVTNLTVAGLTKGSVNTGSATTVDLDGTATNTLDVTVNGNITSVTLGGTQKDTSITATADSVLTLASGANFGASTVVKGSGNVTLKGDALELSTKIITNTGTGTLSINLTDDTTANLSNVATSDVTLSVADFKNTLTLNNNNSTVTAKGIGAAATFIVDSTDTIETLTIKTSDATIGAAVLNDVEVTNLVLGANTTITGLKGDGTLNLSGTADVIMTSAAAGSDMAVVDATALVGKLNYTTVTNSTQTVKGGTLKATLTTATEGDDIITFVGQDAGNTINANTKAGTLSVQTGTGADTVNVKALAAGGKIVGTLGAGDDIVKFSDLATKGINHATAQLNIDGGAGIDTILIQDGTKLGTISALSTVTGFEKVVLGGTVVAATADTTATIAASILSGTSIQVTGTTGNDSLTIQGKATAQTIDLSGITFDLAKAVETVAINGGAEADVITGFSGVIGISPTYTIDAAAGDDTIIVGASSTNSTIIGGAGNDTIDLTGAIGINTIVFDAVATNGKDTIKGWGAADVINVKLAGSGAIGGEVAVSLGTKSAITTSQASILNTNGTAGNLTSGGTATVTDWTDLVDVSAYLAERLAVGNTENQVFIINDTTTGANKTYIYNFVEADSGTDIDANELVLTGVIENGGVALSVANVIF